jgi:hypothetical protein
MRRIQCARNGCWLDIDGAAPELCPKCGNALAVDSPSAPSVTPGKTKPKTKPKRVRPSRARGLSDSAKTTAS